MLCMQLCIYVDKHASRDKGLCSSYRLKHNSRNTLYECICIVYEWMHACVNVCMQQCMHSAIYLTNRRRTEAKTNFLNSWKHLGKNNTCLHIGSFVFFYVPVAYLMHFTYRRWFLFSFGRGGGGGGWYEVNILRTAPYISRAIGKGGPWKSRLFRGLHFKDHWKGWPRVPFQGPKNSRFSRTAPSKRPRNWICPHQNNYVPRHINKRYINS
jgi:hypothetical protein